MKNCVKTYLLQENVRALLVTEVAFGLNSIECCLRCGHDGSLLKMSPDSYPLIKDVISQQSFKGWKKSGSVVSPGRYWTVNTSESRNAADDCSLSEVLESNAPKKYYLSAKAAAGILRRAERRGRKLPEKLQEALEFQTKQ